jgi:predicted RNA binding protein with dsRBD fold (UPF0201 family)
MSLTVAVKTPLQPTEDQAKVERALLKLFPSAKIERITGPDETIILSIRGSGLECLANIRNLIKQERIRSAARAVLIRNTRGRSIQIYLNKQAAFMGRVSFCQPVGESPHGPILVELDCDDPQSAIDYLASPPNLSLDAEVTQRRRR